MFLIRDRRSDFILCSFENSEEGERFFDSIPSGMLNYEIYTEELPLEYPYYSVYTTKSDCVDFLNSKVVIMKPEDIHSLAKGIKRNLEYEKRDDMDSCYFTVEIAKEDGIAWGIREKIGLPTVAFINGVKTVIPCLFDHEHMWAGALDKLKSMGIPLGFMYRRELGEFRKNRKKHRILNSLLNLYNNELLSVKGKKKLLNLMEIT